MDICANSVDQDEMLIMSDLIIIYTAYRLVNDHLLNPLCTKNGHVQIQIWKIHKLMDERAKACKTACIFMEVSK